VYDEEGEVRVKVGSEPEVALIPGSTLYQYLYLHSMIHLLSDSDIATE